jgi:hypothetical protein
MITQDQLRRMSSEESSAWLDSLSADDSLIVGCPVGKRYTLVFVSIVKRLLAQEMSPAYRLKFLEWLGKCGDTWLSPATIGIVEPMCDQGDEMVREARKLGAKKMLDVVGQFDVFSAFVSLNPSLLTAIKIISGRHMEIA